MKYSKEEVMQYVREEDVKFIRLAFCNVFGKQKNISIMPEELPRAFECGIAIDASAIAGFGDENHSDLFLHPDADTLMPLPWRPEHGRVVRMFCYITHPDGKTFECDTRSILKKQFRIPKMQDSNSSLVLNRNFTCLLWMIMGTRPKSLMITQDIWILPRKTEAKISAEKYV